MQTSNSQMNLSFEEAVDHQLLEGHRADAFAKLEALDDLFEFCRLIARSRAADDQITLGAKGDIWWSPAQERAWQERCP